MEVKRLNICGRYVGSHVLLLVMLAMMVVVTVLSFTAPGRIASSVTALQAVASTWASRTAFACDPQSSVGPNEVVISLDQIIKSPVALEQDNAKLLHRIKTQYLQPPSTEPYSLTVQLDPSQGQSAAIREILGDVRNGFFIECGALDGETRSNTLELERTFGWTGLLVEGDPRNYKLILKKHRKAWTAGVCLSTKPYPNTVMFQQQFNLGKISSLDPNSGKREGHVEVQCLPVFSLMLALNVTTIDYFSLDVEGVELEVLQTIPWDKVNIKTLSVEFIHGVQGKSVLRKFMEDRGYWVYKEVSKSNGWANDFIFVKTSYKKRTDVVKQ